MTRSSRSKSHKQSKHSSKEAREYYSGSDEDVRMKERSSNGGKEDVVVSVKMLKDSLSSGERVKHGKDLCNTHSNGDLSEKNHGGSDRWNGGSSDDKGLGLNIENKESSKSKELSKSKSSRKYDSDSVSLGISEKDESKRENRGEKRKSEKESARKESSHYKEYKESKDKDRGSDRGRKVDKLGAEESSKQVENQSSKRGKEITEWPIEGELRNPELEKELEKRMRRRGEASSDKDKYQDSIKESEDRRLSTRNDRSKDERHKNEEYVDIKETRQKDEKNRDVKHRGESERYNKHRDDKYDKYDKFREDKYSEDGHKESKYKDDKYIETGDKCERSRDRKRRQDDDRDYRHKEEKRAQECRQDDDRDYRHKEEKRAQYSKHLRDDNAGPDLYHRKTNNRDGSPVYDDPVGRYKDDKDKRIRNEKDESSDYRSRSGKKEQRPELEKRSSAKDEPASERGRPGSRYADVEVPTSHSRRRSSPNRSSYPTRDHHRVSKQEDRARYDVHSSRDYNSAPGPSDKKVTSKDDGYMGDDLSGEKRMRPESPSSSNERRSLIKSDDRKNLNVDESGPGPGPRSGGAKDTFKDGKGSRELVNEAHMNNDLSQVDNDNLSVSSPYSRNSHFSEDERSKSNNRQRRMVDPNMNRSQSQFQGQSQGHWKNVPNWPPPMATGGYIPFQHVPLPMFHPLMQQFPPPMFGRPPMKLNPGLPYHVSDHGRPLGWRNQVDDPVPPSLHGWDTNNSVFGDESHLYGRLDWDRRSQLSNHEWDQNAGSSMEGQFGQQKDEYLSGPPGQPDESEQNQLHIQPETSNLDKNGHEAQMPGGSPKIVEVVNEDNDSIITRTYLSRVDVSKDLAHPELYDQCVSIMDFDQDDFSQPVDFDCKILFLKESVETNVTDSATLFAAINESVFQKAMFLYKNQKEDFHPVNKENVFHKEKGNSANDGKPAAEVAAVDTTMEVNKENDEPSNKPEEAMDMEVDRADVSIAEVSEVNESLAASASGDLLPCKAEDANADEKNGDIVVLSGVSSAEMAVMPTESIEFGSVNLNRIHHHSPESTH